MAIVSGDGQTVRQHERLANALTVLVKDGLGNPLPGIRVFLGKTGRTGGTTTGADGTATFGRDNDTLSFSYFHFSGMQSVVASVTTSAAGGIPPVTFRFNVLASPYDFDGLYNCQSGSATDSSPPTFPQMQVTNGLASMDSASGSVNGAGTVMLSRGSGASLVRYSGFIQIDAPSGTAGVFQGTVEDIPFGQPNGNVRLWTCGRV